VALTVTLKGLPTEAEPGAETLTPETFTSACPLTAVVALPEPELLPVLGSVRCRAAMTALAEPVKVWLDGPEQVTDQVFWTGSDVLEFRLRPVSLWLPAGAFVQSAGTVRSRVASAVAALTGPLLCKVALTVTLKGLPVLAEAGAVTVTLVTFTSA
jgi:hypothetical protein